MLDSSPVALPPISSRRPLKRSASVASLPTPPRTRHKGKHARGGSQYDSDSDRSDTASETEGDESGRMGASGAESKYKKRRTSLAQAEKEEEDAFWLGGDPSKAKEEEGEKNEKRPQPIARTSSFAAPPLLYRRATGTVASWSTTGQAPVSPPPSNRRHGAGTSGGLFAAPGRLVKGLPARSSAPVTPPPKKKAGPVRDSPNNPFLVSPTTDVPASPSDFSSTDASPGSPMRVHPMDEKPMITMVFRGQRGQIPNPYFNHRDNRPKSPSLESRLPVDHVDYSPSAQCPPKLLFPQARRHHRKVSSSSKHRTLEKKEPGSSSTLTSARDGRMGRLGHVRSSSTTLHSDSDADDDSDDLGKIKPMKLNFKRGMSPDRKAEGGLAGVRIPPVPVPHADL